MNTIQHDKTSVKSSWFGPIPDHEESTAGTWRFIGEWVWSIKDAWAEAWNTDLAKWLKDSITLTIASLMMAIITVTLPLWVVPVAIYSRRSCQRHG